MIYLHNEDHQDTTKFLNSFCTEDISTFIDAQFIFWCCSVTNSEGYRASLKLNVTTYPFVCFVRGLWIVE